MLSKVLLPRNKIISVLGLIATHSLNELKIELEAPKITE
ncbi:MAG: hypothetical protein DID92_2727745517 [Candidatus Nitrotoga sp. SPKER]|nr:MAG: hypothetical protein DID92_2727745517 [Candidatus Nitrotoga sp. SPKER]